MRPATFGISERHHKDRRNKTRIDYHLPNRYLVEHVSSPNLYTHYLWRHAVRAINRVKKPEQFGNPIVT
jgi:hypothetical protein